MNAELWLPIPGYEGLYEVSNFGHVKSVADKKPYRDGFRSKQERILKPGIINGGYLQVSLTCSGQKKSMLVHRLVANSFIPNPKCLPQINHIDGNKTNNHVSNLEWCTAKENMVHSVTNGIRTDMKPVCMVAPSGEVVKTFFSMHDAERNTGIKRPNIRGCLKHSHKKAGGYFWRYATNGGDGHDR